VLLKTAANTALLNSCRPRRKTVQGKNRRAKTGETWGTL